MSDIHLVLSKVKPSFTAAESACDFVWGAEEIGVIIGRNARQAHLRAKA
jgi:hypothetical protein